MKAKPKQPRNLYRAQLNCKIAMDALNSNSGENRIGYALFCLCSAVGDIAKHLDEQGKEAKP